MKVNIKYEMIGLYYTYMVFLKPYLPEILTFSIIIITL